MAMLNNQRVTILFLVLSRVKRKHLYTHHQHGMKTCFFNNLGTSVSQRVHATMADLMADVSVIQRVSIASNTCMAI